MKTATSPAPATRRAPARGRWAPARDTARRLCGRRAITSSASPVAAPPPGETNEWPRPRSAGGRQLLDQQHLVGRRHDRVSFCRPSRGPPGRPSPIRQAHRDSSSRSEAGGGTSSPARTCTADTTPAAGAGTENSIFIASRTTSVSPACHGLARPGRRPAARCPASGPPAPPPAPRPAARPRRADRVLPAVVQRPAVDSHGAGPGWSADHGLPLAPRRRRPGARPPGSLCNQLRRPISRSTKSVSSVSGSNAGWAISQPRNPRFVRTPSTAVSAQHRRHALDAGVAILGVGDHLRQQRVVAQADVVARAHAAVHAHARPRGAQRSRRPAAGTKPAAGSSA